MMFPKWRQYYQHIKPKRPWPVFGLQRKLLTAYAILILGLIISLLVVVESRYRASIAAQVAKRGLTIAEQLAAVSFNSLVMYNWTNLVQDVKKVSDEADVLYAIILQRNGTVAAHSERPDLQHQSLSPSAVNQKAQASEVPLTQYIPRAPDMASDAYDIAAPIVSPDGQKWGLVRIGLSLQDMHANIRQTRLWIALVGGMGGALSLVAVGWLARRIAAPIQDLTAGTQAVARGDLQHVIAVRTRDEIAVLARNFNRMTSELGKHHTALETTNRELDQKVHELSRLANYNATILASMDNGLMTLDLEGRLESMNEAAETILGVSAASRRGDHYSRLITPDSLFAQVIERTLQSQAPMQAPRFEFIRPDGLAIPLGLRTAMRHDHTETFGLVAIFEDLSSIQALERRLRRADRLAALGQVTAGLAHEIKNPLTSVRAFAQLVRQKHHDPNFIAQFDRVVLSEIDRINGIIEELLDVTRSRPLAQRPVDLLDVLGRVTDTHAEIMAQHHICPTTDWPATLPSLNADPEQLQRAFGNLVLNAIEAMPHGGALNMACRTAPKSIANVVAPDLAARQDDSARELYASEVEVTVQDTGEGIPSDQLDHLFTPFFTTKKRGTGLGLALTHKIIEDHGGSIHIDSKLGEGTTVTVRLPATATVS